MQKLFVDRLRNIMLFIGVNLFVLFTITGFLGVKTYALTINSSYRECDNNAVLRCGALTTEDVGIKYNDVNDKTAKVIFNDFGIYSTDIDAMNKYTKVGSVTKAGNVYVGDDLVATDAVTAGRQNIPGSTPVSSGGITYYRRSPSVSFRSSTLPAFVVFDANHKFKYAIISSCGNPVTAVPVVAQVSPPTPNVVEKTVIKEAPPPVTALKINEAPALPVTQEIPSVGTDIGGYISATAFIAVVGAIGHSVYMYLKRQNYV